MTGAGKLLETAGKTRHEQCLDTTRSSRRAGIRTEYATGLFQQFDPNVSNVCGDEDRFFQFWKDP
jgi:hypothetical protein